jgi:hypothetical protein
MGVTGLASIPLLAAPHKRVVAVVAVGAITYLAHGFEVFLGPRIRRNDKSEAERTGTAFLTLPERLTTKSA